MRLISLSFLYTDPRTFVCRFQYALAYIHGQQAKTQYLASILSVLGITLACYLALDCIGYKAVALVLLVMVSILAMPLSCPGLSDQNILQPSQTWSDPEAYKEKTIHLAQSFHKNFLKYASEASAEILAGGLNQFSEIDPNQGGSDDIRG